MMGAVIFKLRAEQDAVLPAVNGRLMHAAFFHLLQEVSPDASAYLHDKLTMKPFTVSMLSLPEWKRGKFEGIHTVTKGTVFYWRVTALWEKLLQMILSVPRGYHVQAGRLSLTVEEVSADSEKYGRSGLLDERQLVAYTLSIEKIHSVTFHFLSPASFRVDDVDYAFPDPALLWGSLADKWIRAGFPLDMTDKDDIKAAAAGLLPAFWSGRSRKIYLGRDRGVLAFTGTFTYDLSGLSLEWRQMLLLLAQFATFSGVGRLCGQGFGEVEISYD